MNTAATINVFALDDCDWWAGETLQACVEEAQRQCGKDCYSDPDYYSGPMSDETMQQHRFINDDGTMSTFAAELARSIAAGETFPRLFASTEF